MCTTMYCGALVAPFSPFRLSSYCIVMAVSIVDPCSCILGTHAKLWPCLCNVVLYSCGSHCCIVSATCGVRRFGACNQNAALLQPEVLLIKSLPLGNLIPVTCHAMVPITRVTLIALVCAPTPIVATLECKFATALIADPELLPTVNVTPVALHGSTSIICAPTGTAATLQCPPRMPNILQPELLPTGNVIPVAPHHLLVMIIRAPPTVMAASPQRNPFFNYRLWITRLST